MKLISAIMPSKNGPEFVERAIRCFEAQTYPCKELVVVTSGEIAEDVWFSMRRSARKAELPFPGRWINIHYVQEGLSIGELRNIACRVSRGSVIAFWDDDDVSSPDRLACSMEAIDNGALIVGSSLAIYEEPATGKKWRWDGMKFRPALLLGGTLVFRREQWEAMPFQDVSTGEDVRWLCEKMGTAEFMRVWPRDKPYSGLWHDLRDETLYTATVHPGNTSPKVTDSIGWEAL